MVPVWDSCEDDGYKKVPFTCYEDPFWLLGAVGVGHRVVELVIALAVTESHFPFPVTKGGLPAPRFMV